MPHQQATTRVPLDCHRQSDWLARWKDRLAGVTLVVGLLWIATELLLSRPSSFGASRGPVAGVHQIWESQCGACHVDFTPINSHAWPAPFLGEVGESPQRCQACHAGPVHHAGQSPDLSCGSCHREHRGRDASLVNLPDRDCTQCHRDLGEHMRDKTICQPHIARFAKEAHPAFRSIQSDPGKLKFNHALHLSAGMARQKDGQGGGAIQTLGKIPEPFRARYRDQQQDKTEGSPVRLSCASCHQLDAGDFGVTAEQARTFPFNLLGGRGAGAYMLPIAYENQCQACHPLTIERKIPADASAGYLTIPHRLPPAEIHDLLENFFTARFARGQAGFLDRKITRPLPGKNPDTLGPALRASIAKSVEDAEKDLYLSQRLCAECHFFAGTSVPEAIAIGQARNLRVEPTAVPAVWLRHAKFNHIAHRAVGCADCHTRAGQSQTQTDVLIPDLDTCVKCHASTTQSGTPGARFNCTECHGYHHGENPVQGIGAAKRNPKELQTIMDILTRP